MDIKNLNIGIVIPTYKSRKTICSVIIKIQPQINHIYVIDDACPDNSGLFVIENCKDSRVKVLVNSENLGVGGATLRGYTEALNDGCDIVVKMDSDGQMDAIDLMNIIEPILAGRADYSKGNRFYNIQDLTEMPFLRIMGNSILSFMCKISSGYWDIFDPTNGYTAIHSHALRRLPFDKIKKRYEFESDMLYHLGIIRAVVEDVSIKARYNDEESGIVIKKEIPKFLRMHLLNSIKRIFYSYFLRDVSIASLQLVIGLLLIIAGSFFGINVWLKSVATQIPATAGTVMLVSLMLIFGIQFLLNFIQFDIHSSPRIPLSKKLFDE